MKIVSWNIACRDKTFQYVKENRLNADLYLLQEVKKPKLPNNSRFIFVQIDQSDGEKRSFGNCILSFNSSIKKIKIKTIHVGSLLASEFITSSNLKLAVINLYGILTEYGKGRKFVAPNIHRMLSDLTPLLIGASKEKYKHIVLAGDFNNDRRMDTAKGLYWKKGMKTTKVLFDRIEDFLLTDCIKKKYPNYVRTFKNRSGRDTIPWQLDHMFASNSVYDKLKNIEIIENDETRKLSDHYPIVAEFDL